MCGVRSRRCGCLLDALFAKPELQAGLFGLFRLQRRTISFAWYCSRKYKNPHWYCVALASDSTVLEYEMDILETNCQTQLSQSAGHDAMPMECDDDFSNTATAHSTEDADEVEYVLKGEGELPAVQAIITDQTETEDEEPLGYRCLGDPHLIDMMCRLKLFRDAIYLPIRISFQQQRETLERLAAEVVHTHDNLECFSTGEIRLLFRRAAKKLFRGIENRAKLQVQRFLILKHFEQVEEAMRYRIQCSGALSYPGASWRSWCCNTQCTPSIEVCRDALKRGNRVLTSDQILPRGGIHIVHRLLKEGEAFVNRVLEVRESLFDRKIPV